MESSREFNCKAYPSRQMVWATQVKKTRISERENKFETIFGHVVRIVDELGNRGSVDELTGRLFDQVVEV